MIKQLPYFDREKFKKIAVVSDVEFFDSLEHSPVSLKFFLVKYGDKKLVKDLMEINPDAVLVCSCGAKSIFSGRRVCEAVKANSSVKIMFVNSGEYPDGLDFGAFSDVVVDLPKTYEDRTNLAIELLRLATDTPSRTEIVEKTTTPKEEFLWLLTVGVTISVLSGIFTMAMRMDQVEALTSVISTLSAVTAGRTGLLVRRWIRLVTNP